MKTKSDLKDSVLHVKKLKERSNEVQRPHSWLLGTPVLLSVQCSFHCNSLPPVGINSYRLFFLSHCGSFHEGI